MSITGNFSGIALLRANLAKLARVPAIASKEAASEIDKELAKEFSSGQDPYGNPWKPNKRGTKTLVATGALMGSARATPMAGAGIRIGPLVSYAVYHQTGTKRMPARPVLPYGGLPASWNEAIKRACENAIKRQLEGR